MATPHLTAVHTSGDTGHITLELEIEGTQYLLLVTHDTPGASNGSPEPGEPILVVYDGATDPIARIGLRSGAVGQRWAAMTPAPESDLA